jgi:hypothetical protein
LLGIKDYVAVAVVVVVVVTTWLCSASWHATWLHEVNMWGWSQDCRFLRLPKLF